MRAFSLYPCHVFVQACASLESLLPRRSRLRGSSSQWSRASRCRRVEATRRCTGGCATGTWWPTRWPPLATVWIQGGYLYALYANHGYSMHQIAQLFAVGYSSAATLGTYTSAIGDVGGHRRNCVAYGILYAGSCLLANSPAGLPRSGRRHSYVCSRLPTGAREDTESAGFHRIHLHSAALASPRLHAVL